ncbi:MAG: 50S ribosomal protein L25 [Parcubacteria group bacterium]
MTTHQLTIEATVRDLQNEKTGPIRKSSRIPAVVYGHGKQSTPIVIAYMPFEKVHRVAKGGLIDLKIGSDKPVKVVIQEVQTDPVSGKFEHVDFHQVSLTEKLTTDIAINFIGESKAVKELGGVLVRNLDHVRVECLAKDLVESLDVDLGSLMTFNDLIRVKDLLVPSGIIIKNKEDDVVVLVQEPRTEEELKALEETPEQPIEEVEVAKKGKKDEEEVPEEGSEPTATTEAPPKQEKKK